MAITFALQCGIPEVMAQSTIYALPPKMVMLSAVGTPTFTVAEDLAFTSPKTVTLDTNNEVQLAAGFIQCTTGTTTVFLKAR